jgi:Protein of unknown function (DUF732)
MRIAIAIIGATIALAAPAHADTTDYSGYLHAIAASGNSAETNGKIEAQGDIVCDGLRSGMSPVELANTVKQVDKDLTFVQAVLMVHAAQDYICPDTK